MTVNSVYLMFERLNTGGTPLTPQEIRACVYRGEFNDLLRELAASKGWQTLYGKPNARGKDQELILRFFALLHDLDSYERPMKTFLNSFMGSIGASGVSIVMFFSTSFGTRSTLPLSTLALDLSDRSEI